MRAWRPGQRRDRRGQAFRSWRAGSRQRPDPPAIRPEAEDRPEPGAHDKFHQIPEGALQARYVFDQPDAAVVEDQADAVQEKEDDAVACSAVALAMLEGPLAVTQEGDNRGHDGGDGNGLVLADSLERGGTADSDNCSDTADNEELAALVDQVPESAI